MSGTMCNDNRFDLIAKYKAKLIEATNIETSTDEMTVIDNILFRLWQMGWLDRLELPAASPWHRVEEPPKPHKDVLVTGIEAINNHRVYKVMVNDNGTWRPTDYAPSIRWDYWMPIEPPKEESNA